MVRPAPQSHPRQGEDYHAHLLKYRKSLGPGYQDRLNAVLRAWGKAKAAGMIRDEARITEKLDREAHELGGPICAGPNGTWEDPNGTLD